jgi:hypothetical protein
MIKHIVMWKLAETAESAHKATNAKLMRKMLEELKFKIPEVVTLEVGINCNKSEMWDVVLTTEFKSMEDLNRYQAHQAHQEVVEFVKKVRVDRAAVDYEV